LRIFRRALHRVERTLAYSRRFGKARGLGTLLYSGTLEA
jgi:hypothetical protein